MPKNHISEVVLTPALDMEVSSDDARTELDSHANVVVLGSNSFVFESTGTFNSEIGVAKDVYIADTALAHELPYTKKSICLSD